MRRDTEHPGREFRRWLVTSPRLINPKKDLLRQLLGHRLILHHAKQKMQYRRTVPVEKQRKAPRIAVPHPQHQLGVPIAGRLNWASSGGSMVVNPTVPGRLRDRWVYQRSVDQIRNHLA